MRINTKNFYQGIIRDLERNPFVKVYTDENVNGCEALIEAQTAYGDKVATADLTCINGVVEFTCKGHTIALDSNLRFKGFAPGPGIMEAFIQTVITAVFNMMGDE